ncbi:MAG: DNA polymerase III subunit epsilon [Porticoccaceae bacterium]|nr:MAG: DNA polymerase III subunit epsilon [Porticoccaceae bacterium]
MHAFRRLDWVFRLRQKRYLGQCQHFVMQQYLKSEFPPGKTDYRKVNYLAVDLEMTGLDAQSDHILSIGFVPIENQKVILSGAQHILINSDLGVGQSAVIHGIHDRDLEEATPLETAMGILLEALQGKVLLLHCAQLDMAFLNVASKRLYGQGLFVPVVDTMALEDIRLQRQGRRDSLRLGDCRTRYHLPEYAAHNALIDAVATAELFLAQMRYRFGAHPSALRQILSIV